MDHGGTHDLHDAAAGGTGAQGPGTGAGSGGAGVGGAGFGAAGFGAAGFGGSSTSSSSTRSKSTRLCLLGLPPTLLCHSPPSHKYGHPFSPPDASMARSSPRSLPPPTLPPSPSLASTPYCHRSPRAHSSSHVPYLHSLFLHTIPHRVLPPSLLPLPPLSSLTVSSQPLSDYFRTACPVVSRVLSSLVNDPTASLSSVSALVAAITYFASSRRLEYATRLVSASPSHSLSAKSELALDYDVLQDRQFELKILAATDPHLCAMLLPPKGDPDAPDIPTPRDCAEVVFGQ
ncbi:unnamed protein product [Closterium sp. NIES-54]